MQVLAAIDHQSFVGLALTVKVEDSVLIHRNRQGAGLPALQYR